MKYNPVEQPHALPVNKRPVSAPGKTISHPLSRQALLPPKSKEQTSLQKKQVGVFLAMRLVLRKMYWEWIPPERAARNVIPAFLCCFPSKSAFSQKALH